MRAISLLLLIAALLVAGCGDDESDTAAKPQSEDAELKEGGAAMEKQRKGATITLGDSEFGTMLFDSNKQAIYVFEKDSRNRTACYGDCAEAWPPVFSEGAPRAGNGVQASLLGTIKRRDGRTQVTYAGKPLYFYAHEAPGEVRCHNVDLNGGFWWVVGPNGKRRQ